MYKKLIFSILMLLLVNIASAQNQISDSLKQKIALYIDSLLRLKMDSVARISKPKANPSPRFRYAIALTGVLNEGNINRKLADLKTEFSWTGKWLEIDLHPRFAFGEQAGVLAEREPYTDLTINILHKKKIYAFAITNMEASNLRGINLRWLGGAGIGWHIIRTSRANLSISNMLLYEGTDFVAGKVDVELWRNSTRLKGKYNLWNDRIVIKHWIYIQPSLSVRNFRWNGIVAIEYPINTHLSFRFNLEDTYESLVAEGRKNEDRKWSVGLNYALK